MLFSEFHNGSPVANEHLMKSIEAFVAKALGIPVARLSDDVAYQSIVEWDSFAHVQMMLALEQELNVEITNELMVESIDPRHQGLCQPPASQRRGGGGAGAGYRSCRSPASRD